MLKKSSPLSKLKYKRPPPSLNPSFLKLLLRLHVTLDIPLQPVTKFLFPPHLVFAHPIKEKGLFFAAILA